MDIGCVDFMTEEIYKEVMLANGRLIESLLCEIEVEGNPSDGEFDHYELTFSFESITEEWKQGWWFDAIFLMPVF